MNEASNGRRGAARALGRCLIAVLISLSVVTPVLMVTASAAHADIDYRSQWNLDPGFPPCIRYGDPAITAFDCYPDDHPPNSGSTFVYGQMTYDDGGQPGNWAGQGPAAVAYIAQGGGDPYSSSFIQADPVFGGWYGFTYPKNSGVASLSVSAQDQAWVFQPSYNGGSTPFGGRGHPSDPTQWESPVVGTAMNYGNATEIPPVVVPSPPDVSATCGADLTAPAGAGLCSATQNSAQSTQSPTYTWTWPDASTSTGTPVSKQFTTDGTDTNFTGTLVADAGGGWTETENVGSSTAPCFGQGCLETNSTFSPEGDPDDPSTQPQIGQTVTVTSTVTNTAPVEIDNLVPAPLTGSIAPGTANATPSSVASLAPGATTTFTWSPQFTAAGQQSLDMHIDATIGSTGRTTFGDDQEDYTVAAGPVTVNSTSDAGESATAANGVCDTGSTIVDGNGNTVAECTLRAAIQTVNTATTPSPITFNIPGSGVQRITPITALPPLTVPTSIDATTQPGYFAGTPAVVIDGSAQGGGDGLVIQAGPTEVLGFDVVNFSSGAGIAFDSGSGSTLDSSVIGFEPGSASSEANQVGVRIKAAQTTIASGVTIGGDSNQAAISALLTAPANATSILAIGVGVLIDSGSSNTVVSGATIGTAQHQNGAGILAAPIDGSEPVGGVSVQGGTFNNFTGVAAFGFGTSSATSVSVTGATLNDNIDVFGLGDVGVLSLASNTFGGGDGSGGVLAIGLPNHALSVIGNTFTVGGVMSISSGGAIINNNNLTNTGIGVVIAGESTAGAGYSPDSVTNNQLSSNLGILADHEDGLVVSGNTTTLTENGVGLWVSSSRNVSITNNTVTTASTGDGSGAAVFDSPGATISGNTFSGGSWGLAAVGGTPSASLFGGFHTNTPAPAAPSAVTGTLAADEGTAGQFASNWQTTEPLDASQFASGATSGSATGDTITGNTITNNQIGVLIGQLPGSVVGTASAGQPNTITGNTQVAVLVSGTDPVSVQGNVMGNNDTVENFDGTFAPVIDEIPPPTSGVPQVTDSFDTSAGTQIDGTLDAAASSVYTIDVYSDPTSTCTSSGTAGLTTWLGSVPVTTDASGYADWSYTASSVIPVGNQIGATATSAAGSTTDPSACQLVDTGTDTTTATPAGVTEVPVASNAGFNIGDTVTIDPGQPDAETATISGFGSLIFGSPLQNAHASGEPIIDGVAVGAVTIAGPSAVAAGATYSATASASGDPAPIYSLANGAPSWLSINPTTGSISGPVPSGTTSFSYLVSANNGVGSAATSATQTVTVTVSTHPSKPAFTSPASLVTTSGSSTSFTVKTTGYPAAAITETGALPTGLTFVANANGTADIAGTPTVTGKFKVKLKAVNQSGSVGQSFTVTVDQAPAITSSTTITERVGVDRTFTITSTGHPVASIAETGTLPAGIHFRANANGTAHLAGTPAAGAGGSYPIEIAATNSAGGPVFQDATIVVAQSPKFTSAPRIVTATGTTLSYAVTTSGYPQATLTESGKLPPGVSFTGGTTGTASLSGPLTKGGTYKVFLKAVSAAGTAKQTLTVVVN